MQIARILNSTGKADQAITEYEALLEKSPKYVPAILAIGTLRDRAGQSDLAKEAYRKVLEIVPDSAAAANNLAWLLTQEEGADLGEALRLSMIAKGAFPNDPHISDTLGWIHLKRESYSLAATQFRQAVEARPEMGTFKYHLALALKGDGKIDEAKEAITQALATGDFPELALAKELLNSLQ
jgi:Flp pilus assembly protein TadD